jgi:hypothetical protein
MRRSFVRRADQAGVSRSVAMKLTGHKSEAVYRRYRIVPEQDLVDAVRHLDAIETRSAAPADSDKTATIKAGATIKS